MSHFTEVKTNLSELDLIFKTLKALNLQYVHNPNGVDAMGFYGDKIRCDIKIDTGTKYDIGLRRTADGTYEFVADWEMLKDVKFDAEALQKKINQRYSYEKVSLTLSEQGYQVEEEGVDEEGNIQMVVSQWA